MPAEVLRWKQGDRVFSLRYTKRELAAAWWKAGQGHKEAVERGRFCVVVPCADKETALELSALFLEQFAIPTCVNWNGADISFYCGGAGSGVQGLMESLLWTVYGYPCNKGLEPLFATRWECWMSNMRVLRRKARRQRERWRNWTGANLPRVG